MNILVIYAYPNKKGLNESIKNTVLCNLKTSRQVQIIDLYEEQFNPVLYFDEEHKRRNLHLNQEMKRYRELISWSDQLIFIYPIWWSSMPAVLKGFIDRVFAKDFAYRYKGLIPIGLLKGKKSWIITTHDSPAMYAKFIQKDYGKILKKQILKMCGIKTIKHSTLAYVRGSSESKRESFLGKIASFASKL